MRCKALCGQALHLHADDEADSRLDLAALLDRYRPSQHLYVCGPKGMINAAVAAARARGWADDHVHVELFVEAAAQQGDASFEVELRATGMTLQVPADKTILEAMEAAGCSRCSTAGVASAGCARPPCSKACPITATTF